MIQFNSVNKKIRPLVFWPPFSVLLASLIMSFVDRAGFLSWATKTNSWILDHFAWLFSGASFYFVICCAFVLFSDFGRIKIGGRDAKPILNLWSWFAITLCTTIAVGILFWAVGEPMYHWAGPPVGLGIGAKSPEATRFALSTLFLHWSFTPYAIYSVPALMFALAFHNRKLPFTLAAMFFPFFKGEPPRALGIVVDATCLLALVLGMAASLGSGALTISGGIQHYLAVSGSPALLGLIIGAIVTCFCLSAITGLLNGIKFLSDLNARIFFAIAIFVFIFGPTLKIISLGLEALGYYLTHFFELSLYLGAFHGDSWPRSWSVFYWANWLAWAPVTAMFLGRIAYGYSVRAFLVVNWILPSFFAIAWMSIFGGAALSLQNGGAVDLASIVSGQGPENAVYTLFQQLPLSALVIALFVATTFLSYVTGADANTEAMGAISSEGVTSENPESSTLIKLVWGISLGVVTWIMVSFAGIDGIRMLSNLGGLPALFLVLAVSIGLSRMFFSGKYRDL